MNLPTVSVYITTFYSFVRSLLSLMVIANLVRVLGGPPPPLTSALQYRSELQLLPPDRHSTRVLVLTEE